MTVSSDSSRDIKFPEIVANVDSPFGSRKAEASGEFFDSDFEIQVLKGPDEGKTFPLDRKEVTIGAREFKEPDREGCILLSDTSIPKVQAVMRWDEELKRYVIHHQGTGTPTVVNGRISKKSLLHPDFRVQMGKTTFQMVSIKEKKLKESAVMWEKFKTGEKKGEEVLDTGYKLVVVEGSDKGASFDLDKSLMIVGKSKGPGDIRDTYGILLCDESLPEELALLVWNSSERKYEIYQSENSPVPIRLFRVVETEGGKQAVGQGYNNLLEDKDSIKAGDTVMVIHKATGEETRDAKIDIEKELAPAVEESKEDRVEHTQPGHFRIDYVFEILEGSEKGHKISLLSDEIKEGRLITFGSPGSSRQNDVEIEDGDVANTQGYFEFSEGNLYLVNEAEPLIVLVNNYEIHANEKIVLNGGDHLKIGKTVFGFTDNRMIAALRKYKLSVISGAEEDREKQYSILKTMVFLGRGSACDVRLHDPEISRLHAVLSFRAGRFQVEHKSKVNPTFVNGVSLKRGQGRIIFPGDKVYLSSKTILQLVRTGN